MREYQRKMAVADYFYPASPAVLKRMFSEWSAGVEKKERPLMVLLPHAGYIYSGSVAYQVLEQVECPGHFFVCGPNHTGMGKVFSIFPGKGWATPFGVMEVDEEMSERIVQHVRIAQFDTVAHIEEHSVEVQVNLLHYFRPDGKLVAGVLSALDYEVLVEAGEQLAEVFQPYQGKVLLVASSDMSHYLPEQEARKMDQMALEALLALDEKDLFRKVKQERITMCGIGPAVVLLRAAKKMGAATARLVRYTSSAEATGDSSSVVGYAGVMIL